MKHTVTLTITRAGSHETLGDWENDHTIEVEFTYVPAIPERGPSYSSGGEPGEPACLEDVKLLKVDGYPKPGNALNEDGMIWDEIENSVECGDYDEQILNNFDAADDGPDPDDLRDAAIDRELDQGYDDGE